MSDVLKILGVAFITVILELMLHRQGKDFAHLITLAACSMVIVVATTYLKPIFDFMETLQDIAGTQESLFAILLKSVGIGLIGEIACLVCTDTGNAALGKGIQILTSAVILWLALPLMNALLELVQQMMGNL